MFYMVDNLICQKLELKIYYYPILLTAMLVGCKPANKKVTPFVKTNIQYKPGSCCGKLPARFGLVVPAISNHHFRSKKKAN